MKYIYEFITYYPNITRPLFGLSISIILIIGYFILMQVMKKQVDGLKKIIVAEEILISCLTTVWLSVFFRLHIVIVLWIIFYVLYMKIETKNRLIKYYYYIPCKKYNDVKFQKKISNVAFIKSFTEISSIKKDVWLNFKDETIIRDEWKKTRFPLKTYASNLLILSIIKYSIGWEYGINTLFELRYLDIVSGLIGFVYLLYVLEYWIVVINDIGPGSSKGFNLRFISTWTLICVSFYLLMRG